ncbi:MAG: DJ-1/PfpI family protein, partial [Actinomycetia bacterium]|nr:DJ-1/PfpI family protein [Actinomycetes bacterium]
LGGAAPDITGGPDMPTSEATDTDRPVTAWLRDVARDGLVLGVCTGARLVAEAGLLDGRDATSHWYRLASLEKAHPDVRWERGVRYVDEGNVITTGGLLSSIDGTLRVVERFLGADSAAAAAEAVAWHHYSPGAAAALPGSSLTPTEAFLHLINTGFRADTTTVGVVLADGVSELELAAAFDPYTEVKGARTLAVGPGGSSIRSLHGLTFVPRADLEPSTTGTLDWLIVPGAAVAAGPDPSVTDAVRDVEVPVAYLHRQPGFAFDEALREMARRMDVPTATWTAKLLELPTDGIRLAGSSWPWLPSLHAVGLGLVGFATALGATRLVRRTRRRT